jgi:hypothetical protein
MNLTASFHLITPLFTNRSDELSLSLLVRLADHQVGVLLSEGKTELREAWDDLFGLKETSPGTDTTDRLSLDYLTVLMAFAELV